MRSARTRATGASRARLAWLAAALLVLPGCRKTKPAVVDAGAPIATAPIVVVPPVVDAGPSPAMIARAADLDRAKGWLADLQFLLAKKLTTSPQLVSGEGDASAICDAATSARAKTSDAEIAASLDESLGLCAFDVPLLVAHESLDQLKGSKSQASVRLMCEISQKQIAKAKAVHPTDPRVKRAEYRRGSMCH